MKETTIKRIKSAINVLEHLMHECPDVTEMLEEQITSLEQVIEGDFICPFCQESGFDLVGLKYHLMCHCIQYQETPDLGHEE